MFAFRQDLHYHGFQAARKVWTPAVGYFLTERMEWPHAWDSLFCFHVFIIMYTAVEILQSKTSRGYNSQSWRKHVSVSSCLVSHCKLHQALRFKSTALRTRLKYCS